MPVVLQSPCCNKWTCSPRRQWFCICALVKLQKVATRRRYLAPNLLLQPSRTASNRTTPPGSLRISCGLRIWMRVMCPSSQWMPRWWRSLLGKKVTVQLCLYVRNINASDAHLHMNGQLEKWLPHRLLRLCNVLWALVNCEVIIIALFLTWQVFCDNAKHILVCGGRSQPFLSSPEVEHCVALCDFSCNRKIINNNYFNMWRIL